MLCGCQLVVRADEKSIRNKLVYTQLNLILPLPGINTVINKEVIHQLRNLGIVKEKSLIPFLVT